MVESGRPLGHRAGRSPNPRPLPHRASRGGRGDLRMVVPGSACIAQVLKRSPALCTHARANAAVNGALHDGSFESGSIESRPPASSTARSATVRGLRYYPVLHEVGDSLGPWAKPGGPGASTTEASTPSPTLYRPRTAASPCPRPIPWAGIHRGGQHGSACRAMQGVAAGKHRRGRLQTRTHT
jgi:hypothetical protein